MNNTGYDIECPSFENYMKDKKKKIQKKKKEKKKKENQLVPVEVNVKRPALDFAQPVDAGLIKILDTPVINKVFSEIVKKTIDVEYGILLSQGIRVDIHDPEIASALKYCAGILGISVPYTVASSALPGINAATTGTDEFCYMIISSMLKDIMDREELLFVLGHECGHIALGHILYHSVVDSVCDMAELLLKVGPKVHEIITWPLNAWHRRSEISADRAGLLCCGNINAACKALLKTEAGFMNIENIDIDAYIDDSNFELQKNQIGKFREIQLSHPILSKRMEALKLFANSEKFYRLNGFQVSPNKKLLTDEELEQETEKIINILIWSGKR